MGHHIDSQGRFQSDKYDWLPTDMILVSTRNPASEGAVYTWLATRGHVELVDEPLEESERPRVKLLLDFNDKASWPILDVLAQGHAEGDPGLSEDVWGRLIDLGWRRDPERRT